MGCECPIKVTSVCTHPDEVTLRVGDWYYGTYAEFYPSYATCPNITWYSSNSNIASVNQSNGYIYGVSAGTTKIYATANDGSGCNDYITVTVVNRPVLVNCVDISQNLIYLQEGDECTLSATVCPENASNKALLWSTSNLNVASVNSNGKVTANSRGCATITAMAQDGSLERDCCDICVTGDTLVTSVSVNPSSKDMFVGDSDELLETVCPPEATRKCVVWSSSNSNIVSVNPDSGLIYAKAVGTADIYASATDGSGKVGSCCVTVKPIVVVDSVTVCPDSKTMTVGECICLDATICPEDAKNKSVRWSSNNTSIASVNKYDGTVTAKSVGKATIYATAQDGSGKRGECTITVKNATNPVEDIGLTKVSESTVADPIDVYSGAHIIKATLMTMFGGQGLKLVANYDSSRLASGVLGVGWYHNFEKRLEITGSEARVYSSPSLYSKYTSNGNSSVFTCTTASKKGYTLTVDCSQYFPYQLDCNSDHTELYDCEGRLSKIIDHQGFKTQIRYTDTLITITDEVTGKKLYMEKDSTGKIARIYDDASRQATLAYSGNLLVGICDVKGNTLSYTYNDDGQVLTGIDSKGTCYFTNTYDDCGRVIAQRDGITGSIASTFAYPSIYKRVTTDRNGNTSTRVFDSNGLLKSHINECGQTKYYSYDNRFNIVEETDAKGNSVTKSYNSFNKPTVITDKRGNKTYLFYDSNGNVTKIKYPGVNGVVAEETFTYNSRNQITQHVDLRGTSTVYTYDASAMPQSKKVGSRNAIQYTYQNGLLTAETDARGYTNKFSYNAIGQLIAKTDAYNDTTSYEYDASGNLLKTTYSNGKTIINTYDGNSQKISVTDANGNRTDYSYNGNMKNDVIRFPDGSTISYTFDGEDRPVSVTDQAGNVTTIQYDKCGRVTFKRFSDGGAVAFRYDEVGNIIEESNEGYATTIKTYDENGNVLSVTDNDGNVTRYNYDAMSRVIRAVNAVSGTTLFEYSAAGDLLSETDALGNKKTYTYDAFGNRLTAVDAKGNTTTYTYDANGNVLTVINALNYITTYSYDRLNRLVKVTDTNNNTMMYGYDALGRRTTITDGRNNVFTTMYDGNGNVTQTIDAKGNTITETVYDSLNRPIKVIEALGKTTSYTYTALGKVESVTDSLNNRKEYGYDSRGRNTSVRDANNNSSTCYYDLMGNIINLTGPLGGATNYDYDSMGRLVAESTASNGMKYYTYNALNVKESLTNARGQIRKFFYDAAGRITGYVGAEDSVSYNYDENGNVLTVVDKNGTITREYDELNRVIKYTDTYGKSIRYEYDTIGNLVGITYPDNTSVLYVYDANHNLIAVHDWANRITTYTYDENNRVIGVTKPDGSTTTTVYDNKQRVISTVEKTASNTVISGFEYTYDALDRIICEENLANNTKTCYTYDNLSRVTTRSVQSCCNEVISDECYYYDAAGNITDAPDDCFEYDTNNRLTCFNGDSVSYDADGNMLSCGSKSYQYDSANRLVKADLQTYTYNAEDVRIRNFGIDEDTTYTYNTNCKLSQLLTKTTNGIVTKYIYGLGLIGEECRDSFMTYHFDYRGSTVALTDICGNITDTFKYDTYGYLTEHIGINLVLFGYNGRDGVVTDSNGLLYMRARYYSPKMRRFINADIIPGNISNAITLNRYAYANGNPVSNIDPFGLSAERGKLFEEKYNNFIEAMNQIFSYSKKIGSASYYNDLGSIIHYQNYEVIGGNGNIDIDKIIKNQIKVSETLEFKKSDVIFETGTDLSYKIGYSSNIDDYSSVTASYIYYADGSTSTEYTITTKTQDGVALATTMGLKVNPDDNSKTQVPVTEPETENQYDFSFGFNWEMDSEFSNDAYSILVLAVFVICALAGAPIIFA